MQNTSGLPVDVVRVDGRSTGLELTDTGRDLLQITNRLFAQEKEAELYLRESKELAPDICASE